MAKKESVNGVRIYSQHGPGCRHKDTSITHCDCCKWMQWQQDGKQFRKSANSRSRAGAVAAAEQKAAELEALARGEAPPVMKEQKLLETAVDSWLRWREGKKLTTNKHEVIGQRLIAWARQRNWIYLSQIQKAALVDWQGTWKYRSGDSSSLKVHWSVLGSFFSWCIGAGMLEVSPMPHGPQFTIQYKKREVQPFTEAQVETIIAAVNKAQGLFWDEAMHHRVRTFIRLMRYSGMAIRDTATLSRVQLEDDNAIRGNRRKTHERFRVVIPMWLANDLRALPCDQPEYFFWNRIPRGSRRLQSPKEIAAAWTVILRSVFRLAGIKDGHSHQFRHTFISWQLAHGSSVEDVSRMAGVSPAMIRKTYEHWIKEVEDRLDESQRKVWLRMGLDEHGNPKTPTTVN